VVTYSRILRSLTPSTNPGWRESVREIGGDPLPDPTRSCCRTPSVKHKTYMRGHNGLRSPINRPGTAIASGARTPGRTCRNPTGSQPLRQPMGRSGSSAPLPALVRESRPDRHCAEHAADSASSPLDRAGADGAEINISGTARAASVGRGFPGARDLPCPDCPRPNDHGSPV